MHILRRYNITIYSKKCYFSHVGNFIFQEKSTEADMIEDSYDAYEEDIAVAHFYFKEPMVFEYTRHVKGYPQS